MKNHLKTITAPKTWLISRQRGSFIIKPNPGGHPLDMGLPIGVLLRDSLSLGQTSAEVQKLLRSQVVLLDGKRCTDHRALVGLFDTLSLPSIKKVYRLVLDQQGRLAIKEISAEESLMKICKVTGKTILPGGKIQVHLHDGKNIIFSEKVSVGDSLVVTLPQLQVKNILPLKSGMQIFLTRGKHRGDVGKLIQIHGKEARYLSAGKEVETLAQYLFVIGETNSLMSVQL